MIETIAIRIGTNARNEAKTKASTSRAPSPPSSASSKHARALVAAGLLLQRVEAGQVDGRAADRRARERRARVLLGVAGSRRTGESGSGRRVGEREGRAPVVGDEGAVAGRGVGGDPGRPGSASLEARVDLRESARTPGESTVLPGGSVTTGSSGALSPPVPS